MRTEQGPDRSGPCAVSCSERLRSPCRASPATGYWTLLASTFSTIVTSSPTMTPPLSSVWFQLMPQSLRFTTVVAEKPALLPHECPSMLTADEPRNSASNTTDLVRSPVILNLSLPARATLVLLNDSVESLSPLKKLGLLRSASRRSLPVSTL